MRPRLKVLASRIPLRQGVLGHSFFGHSFFRGFRCKNGAAVGARYHRWGQVRKTNRPIGRQKPGICLFLQPITFGMAKSTETPRTDARTDALSGKNAPRNPFSREKSTNKRLQPRSRGINPAVVFFLGRRSRKYDSCEKKNAVTGGKMFFASTLFRGNKSTDGMAKTWNPALLRSDRILRCPLPAIKSIDEGVGEIDRTFRLRRTESIPLAILSLKCPLLSSPPRPSPRGPPPEAPPRGPR